MNKHIRPIISYEEKTWKLVLANKEIIGKNKREIASMISELIGMEVHLDMPKLSDIIKIYIGHASISIARTARGWRGVS